MQPNGKLPKQILLFAGTSEGRILAQCLSGLCPVTACVASGYGAAILQDIPNIIVLPGRKNQEEIAALLTPHTTVIDATHPYAVEVSQNIRAACTAVGAPLLRLVRSEGDIPQPEKTFPTLAAATKYLLGTEGNVLITTGSKELQALAPLLAACPQRVYLRMLPDPPAIEKAMDAGVLQKNLICMQGPFSTQINKAILQQIDAKFLLTKLSGAAGGFAEKLEAATAIGAQLLVIARPVQETGLTLQQLLQQFGLALPQAPPATPARFPMFISLVGQKAVVFGAGAIAARRVPILLDFGAAVTVYAPQITTPLPQHSGLTYVPVPYSPHLIQGAALVLAATNDRQVNKAIGQQCKMLGVPVSVADKKEECSFYFPSVIKTNKYTLGISANGQNHGFAKQLTQELNRFIKENNHDNT